MSLAPADQVILEQTLKPAFRASLVEEHRQQPFGPHSAALSALLLFFRRNPDPALPRYCVLRSGKPPRWAVGHKPLQRGLPITALTDARYNSRGEAEHAVFVRRLADYGLVAPTAATDNLFASGSEPPGVMGYLSALSAPAGGDLSLHVSTTAPRWRAELVRLYSSELAPEGTALRETLVSHCNAIEREAIPQYTPVGSCAIVPLPDHALDAKQGFSLSLFVMPTLPGVGRQALMSQRKGDAGWCLCLDERGVPRFQISTSTGWVTASLHQPLTRGCWFQLAVVVDGAARIVRLACTPAGTRASNRIWFGRGEPQDSVQPLTDVPVAATDTPLLLAAEFQNEHGQPAHCFDGRLERATLIARAVPIADLLAEHADSQHALAALKPLALWDFSVGLTKSGVAQPLHLADVGPNEWHGRLLNHPTRGVTSHGWNGLEPDFRHAPEQYAAAHFHRDDMTDCRWTPQATITLPADLPSGVHAIRLSAIGAEAVYTDRVPFIVTPPADRATAPMLLVLSTNSYLAYANDHVGVDSPRMENFVGRVLQFDEFDLYRHHHRELGSSLYEAHPDGTGICYSSARRPIMTMRPQVETYNGRAWQFTADMQLVDWLDRNGFAVDIVSDLEVHRGGAQLLSRYACVMTGTHPEYPSRPMLDAYGDYIEHSGRLIYMGGNGLYWVTAFAPDDDQVVEIRRWGGSEAWRALPGEYHLSFSGELGGLWRNNGRAPQKTVGVGFVAAALGPGGAGYQRQLPSESPAAWVFSAVDAETFGERGTVGAAAGIEVDSVDPELGTPPDTLVLASSAGKHSDGMLEARENYGMTLASPGGSGNARVRSDMVLMPVAGGGGVFSTGSIAWAGALAHDPALSRILHNVVRRFCNGAPLLD